MSHAEARTSEPSWREWPLALTLVTLTLVMVGKGRFTDALQQPALLLAVHCAVILVAVAAIVRHADVLAYPAHEHSHLQSAADECASLHLLRFGAYLMLMFER